MNIEEAITQAKLAAVTEDDGYIAGLRILYRAYEEAIANYRAAKNASDTSVGTKAVLESLEFTKADNDATNAAMSHVRAAVFAALNQCPNASVLLYDALRDYASNEVKDFRDNIIAQNKSAAGVTDEEVELPELNVEDLKSLKAKAEAFWVVAESPVLERPTIVDSEGNEVVDEFEPATKKSAKTGEISLAWSSLKGISSTSSNEGGDPKSDGISHSRLRYTVDGTELPAGTSLAEVGLWFISSSDWTVSVADLKGAVKKQTGKEYKDLEDLVEIEVNGHTFSRRREQL